MYVNKSGNCLVKEGYQKSFDNGCLLKGNKKFWYGVMKLVQMNISEAYVILQYSVIVVAVESKVMKF